MNKCNKKGVIYKIENQVNGKVYIGQTMAGFKKRIGQHYSSLRNNKHNNEHLQRSWNKHGESNFKASVIEECTIESMDIREAYWIASVRKNGISYNLESGGNLNKVMHESTKKKMKENMKKRWENNEYRRVTLKNLVRMGGENFNAKEVVCINTGEVFDTLSEAANKHNLSVNDIYKVCSGQRKSAGFYKNNTPLQFAYYTGIQEYKLQKIEGLELPKRIVLTNTGEAFSSIRVAAKKYKLSQGSISLCCKGERRSAGKLPNGEYSVWVYENEYDKNKDYSFHRHKGKHNPRARKIVCTTTGEVFHTMKEASIKYGLSNWGSKISMVCTGKRKTAGKLPDGTKLKWMYYEDYKSLAK